MGNQICVISIYVPNIQKAIEFYVETLGFEISKQYGAKIVSLKHGDLPIVLEESETAGGGSGIVLGLQTDDLNKTLNELKDKEVDLIIDTPADCPPGKYISFKDPFGNVLEYLQFD